MAEKEIKDIICYNRKRLGLTQEQLAEKLNVSNKTVSKWETGKSYPDVLLVPAITKELGISINQFFDCEDTKPEVIGKSNKEKLTKIRSNLILAFCFLLFAPIFVVVPTMLLQTIEVAMFCWVSGIVLWLVSIILVIVENSKIKYFNFMKNDQKLAVSLKNITGTYCFVWYLITFVLTFFLVDLLDNRILVCIISILIHLVFSFLIYIILCDCKIKIKTTRNIVFSVFSLLTTVMGIVLIIVYDLFPWCLCFLLSQVQNLIILLTSNGVESNQRKY